METIVLNSTSKSIKAVMSGAPATTNPDYVVSYADNTGTSFTEGSNDGAMNGTTEVTLLSAPAASTRRIAKSISIYNRDTASVTVTIKFDNGGTQRTIATVTLASGDTWTNGLGTFDSSGSQKTGNNSVQKTGDTMTGALTITAAGTALNVTNNIIASNITLTANATANIVFDQFGNLRKIPQSGSDKSTAYTLAANDVGRLIAITTSGSVVVPNGVFSSGDIVSVYNNTAANITMTMNPANSYISGNNTNRNNAVLNVSTRGVATILYLGANNCVVTGSVST